MFSSHVNAPTDRPLLDDEEGLYEIQKGQKAKKGIEVMQTVSYGCPWSADDPRIRTDGYTANRYQQHSDRAVRKTWR